MRASPAAPDPANFVTATPAPGTISSGANSPRTQRSDVSSSRPETRSFPDNAEVNS